MTTLPPMMFLGYRAWGEPEIAAACRSPRVEEICSLGCLRGEPRGSQILWEWFNAASCYDTPEHAGMTVASGMLFTVVGLRLLPMVFGKGGEMSPMDVPTYFGSGVEFRPNDPGPAWESLGFDAVGLQAAWPAQNGYAPQMAMWMCAPLSCNGMAKEYEVNRWCLLDRLEDAMTAARRFAMEEPEPGPYVVVEVLRRRGEGAWAEVVSRHEQRASKKPNDSR